MSSSFRNRLRNQEGLTLIEVLISIVLLVVISLAIYQATTETYRIRDVLVNEGDFYNGIRLSMGVLERDVALIYSPTIMLPDKAPSSPTEPPSAPSQDSNPISDDRSTSFWNAPVDTTGVRPTRLIGTESTLSFISLSHVRMYKDAPESEFTKITYELESDRTGDFDFDSKVLVKTSSSNAFDEDDAKDEFRKTYPLLPGVTKLRYQYYRKDKERWENSWDSDSQDFKNIYPDMIKVTIEVRGPSRMHFEGTYYFKPEIPLNGLHPST